MEVGHLINNSLEYLPFLVVLDHVAIITSTCRVVFASVEAAIVRHDPVAFAVSGHVVVAVPAQDTSDKRIVVGCDATVPLPLRSVLEEFSQDFLPVAKCHELDEISRLAR